MDTPSLTIDAHPLLDAGRLSASFTDSLSARPSPSWLVELLSPTAETPLSATDEVRTAVRDLLRHGGYKPSGRGKPASEFLRRAANDGKLGPINLAVDLCNVVSLHSGLPISVVDVDRLRDPLRIGIPAPDSSYVFNASGQEIRLTGLLCLHDAEGPCANAVKDSHRTKTHDGTTNTLSILWGTNALAGATERARQWYVELLERAEATVVSPPAS
ncbi:MAG: phenylalanine--tRNA ligase beta subunit-related protein [Myxococcota bacterium]